MYFKKEERRKIIILQIAIHTKPNQTKPKRRDEFHPFIHSCNHQFYLCLLCIIIEYFLCIFLAVIVVAIFNRSIAAVIEIEFCNK